LFFHVLVRNDKGVAVKRMVGLIQARHGEVWSIGIGDSANDLPMLRHVDLPLAVQRPGGGYDPDLVRHIERLVRVPAPGPEGWAAAVTRLLMPRANSPDNAAALLRKGFDR
jgi:mannosyl-3-phosphoglycerate phosphatase